MCTLYPVPLSGVILQGSQGITSRVFDTVKIQDVSVSPHSFLLPSYTATPAVQPPPLLPLATSSQFPIAISLLSEECCINGITQGIIFSVQFRCSVVSDSLWPHESQHASPPCPSPTPGVHPNPCPLSQWCHPIITSSVVPFSSCTQSFPASGSFQMSQLFTSAGQSIGVSASTSVLPMNTQDWSPLEWTGWISLQSKGLSRVFSSTTVQKHQFFGAQLSLQSNSHIHTWPLEKP